MTAFDRALLVIITVVLIVGGYQFYFWAQRQTFRDARYLPNTALDRGIAFDPRWVWVYSGLYYPMILLAAFAQRDWPHYAHTVGMFIALLAVQVGFFITWPFAVPAAWRENARLHPNARRYPRSMKFLEMVWSYDKLRNALPSMHVSVATMVDLTISSTWPSFMMVGWLFPVAIGISALKTKQHYIADLGPGACVAVAVYILWNSLTGTW